MTCTMIISVPVHVGVFITLL